MTSASNSEMKSKQLPPHAQVRRYSAFKQFALMLLALGPPRQFISPNRGAIRIDGRPTTMYSRSRVVRHSASHGRNMPSNLMNESLGGVMIPLSGSDILVGSPLSQSPASIVQKRHPMFEATNARIVNVPPLASNVWRKIVPPIDARNVFSALKLDDSVQSGSVSKDVVVEFVDPVVGAKEMMSRCGFVLSSPETSVAQKHLETILSYYQSIASSLGMGANSKSVKCIARIVSSRGPVGQKCPRWHTDKVPLRLITSLIGPGCEFIPTEKEQLIELNRSALDHLDEPDSGIANTLIVRGSDRQHGIVRAREGEMVLLMGKLWESDELSGDALIQACAHRSPPLGSLTGRVLLTVTADSSHM